MKFQWTKTKTKQKSKKRIEALGLYFTHKFRFFVLFLCALLTVCVKNWKWNGVTVALFANCHNALFCLRTWWTSTNGRFKPLALLLCEISNTQIFAHKSIIQPIHHLFGCCFFLITQGQPIGFERIFSKKKYKQTHEKKALTMAHQYQSSTKNAVRLHNGLFAGFILLSVLTIIDGMYISQMFSERKQKKWPNKINAWIKHSNWIFFGLMTEQMSNYQIHRLTHVFGFFVVGFA